jgi:hypothetical protein
MYMSCSACMPRLTFAVDVPREERRSGPHGLEAPVGPLKCVSAMEE